MAPYGQPTLRDLFDDAPTPHIAHPPHTHYRDFYIATDGSFVEGGGGLGVIVETLDGRRVLRLAERDDSPDNNVAEYRALHVGLDALADRAQPTARVGVLVDHNDLAANVNATTLGMRHPDWPDGPVSIPAAGADHWQRIRRHIGRFAGVRAACLRSDRNPAHVLANAPEEYQHVNDEPPEPIRADAEGTIPPPSRAHRHANSD